MTVLDDSEISGADVSDDWSRGVKGPSGSPWPEAVETDVGRVLPDRGVEPLSRSRQVSTGLGAFRMS